MNKLAQPLKDWDQDLMMSREDEYQSLLRTLKIIDHFSLLFVRCSPSNSTNLICRIKEDITNKAIGILKLEQSIDNLYDIIGEFYRQNPVKILFITGIEKSFYDDIKPNYNGKSYFYQKSSVPRVLGHLNLQRERFRDNFDFCIVFLVRSFGLNYFVHRAPDFFDWRSGVFNYNQKEETVKLELECENSEEVTPTMIRESIVSYLAYQEVKDE